MRIAFVTTSLDPGGAETALATLVLGLAAAGARPAVLALRGSGRLVVRLRSAGIRVETLQADGVRTVALQLPAVLRDLGAFRPDHVQGWMYHGNLLATGLAAVCGGRLSWAIRQSLGAPELERATTNRLIRISAHLSRRPSAIVYNSTRARRDHEAIGYAVDRGVVVPNGFDTERLRPDAESRARLRRQLGVSDDIVLVGHVARYHPVKDHAIFLQAAAALPDPNLRLVMAGRGVNPSNTNLASHLERLGLKGRVTLLGEADEVHAVLPGLDVLCVSSRSEAFPNVLGEAMSCGVPCVATDVGDAAQIIGDTGYVVPTGDPARLAEAMRAIVQIGAEARIRLGLLARQRVVEHYSLDSMVEQYRRIYEAPAHRH